MVFTRTKRGANRVSEQLEKAGISADAIHGNKSQGARQKALDGFKTGRTRVLVATDIAARGLDIEEVTHVVNYELPHEPESYVHRIGRTARAGAEGIAIAFCAPEERAQLRDIERLTRQPLTVVGAAPTGEPRAVREQAGHARRQGRPDHRRAQDGRHRPRREDERQQPQAREQAKGPRKPQSPKRGPSRPNRHAGGPTPWAAWSRRAEP
jgi:ATP-dependent RNA helicase RhlE